MSPAHVTSSEMPLRKALQWSVIVVKHLGLLDTTDDARMALEREFVVLGESENLGIYARDPSTDRRIKGYKLWSSAAGVQLLGGDALVIEATAPRPGGHPRELAVLAVGGTAISHDSLGSGPDEHPLIEASDRLYSAVYGLEDAESALECLLFAISVAPGELRPRLLAAIARSYDDVLDFYDEFDDEPPRWNKKGYLKKRKRR